MVQSSVGEEWCREGLGKSDLESVLGKSGVEGKGGVEV